MNVNKKYINALFVDGYLIYLKVSLDILLDWIKMFT